MPYPAVSTIGRLKMFAPDAERARAIATRLRLGVADSLEALAPPLAEHVRFDRDGLAAVIGRIRSAARVRPEVFALYHQVIDLIGASEITRVEGVMDRLLAAGVEANPIEYRHLDPAAIGAEQARLYLGSIIDSIKDEDAAAPGLTPVTEAEFATAAQAMDGYFATLAKAAPDCAGECHELITEMILTSHRADGTPFGSASSFNLWGGVITDISNLSSLIRFVPSLVHEATHLLLFGLATEEPLLTAEPGKIFASPLRDELRTMDGVFHATVVCARMHYALGRLLASDTLDDGDAARVRRTLDHQNELFCAGAKTIHENADLHVVATQMLGEASVYLAEYRGR